MVVPETFPGAKEINRAKIRSDLCDRVRGISIKKLIEEIRPRVPKPEDYEVDTTIDKCIEYIRKEIIDDYPGSIITPYIDHEGKLCFALSFEPTPGENSELSAIASLLPFGKEKKDDT